MGKAGSSIRWGAICAMAAGISFLLPLAFYFFLLPAAGSSATHAADAASFLPWMAERGGVRVALWWTTALGFFLALMGTPRALRELLDAHSPAVARAAELAGILGNFTILLAVLMLVGGEMPLARAYVEAGAAAQPAIVATYEWQRAVTATLFDVFGFLMLGVWSGASSAAALRSGGLPRALGWFGIATAVLCACFAIGFVTRLTWLGEFGIGMLALLALPVWMFWLGVVLWRRHSP